MTKPALRLAVPLVLAALGLARDAQAALDTYTFRDNLQSTEGGLAGNVLQFESNNGDPTPGTFVDATIDVSACPNAPTVRGYSFPQYSGFKSLNKAPIVAGESYTITMIVKFNPLQGAFTRLIDFSDSTLDEGIYVLNGEISFYPVGTFAPGAFVDNQFSVMTLTRDAATSVVALYIGSTPAGTYTDTMKIYVPTNGTLHFFMDNTTGPAPIAESSAGIVTFVRVSDTPTDLAGLAASISDACQAVACGNAKLEPGEGCDDGNNAAGDGCAKNCKIENGFACVESDAGTTDAGTTDDACASAVCDARDDKCGYANGGASTCNQQNAKSVCRSGNCGASSGKCIPMSGCFTDADCASNHCDTPTFMCLPAIAVPDAGQMDAAIQVSPDAGPSSSAEPMPASGGCTCEIGPRQTGAPAIGLLVAGIFVALGRRRDKLRSAKRGPS
ncbi:MAG: hypothetical protein QOI41_6166 [Myxococcales bacterium]|nr:hypothetical protein [Myxococcales bacterium]